jgi:hypothetical protein
VILKLRGVDRWSRRRRCAIRSLTEPCRAPKDEGDNYSGPHRPDGHDADTVARYVELAMCRPPAERCLTHPFDDVVERLIPAIPQVVQEVDLARS